MATFETLALQCATGIALDLLAAISSIESDMRPLAVRDGDRTVVMQSPGEGVAVVVGITDQGREPGIGLMGLTPRQLRTAGLSLQDGFDACNSLKAAAAVFTAAHASASARGAGPAMADRSAIRSWWRPESRFPSASALEAAISSERSKAAALAKTTLVPMATPTGARLPPAATVMAQPRPVPAPMREPNCWDVFARKRAGLAQCESPDVVASASNSRPARSASPPAIMGPATAAAP